MTTPVAPLGWRDSAIGPLWRGEALGNVAPHAFTSNALTFRGERDARDWAALADLLALAPEELIGVTQVHGRQVVTIRPGAPFEPTEADALISIDPSRGVAVRVADCVPVLLADVRGRAVAAIHAGWRGSCAGILGETITRLEELGIAPTELVAAVGPSIGACCYQVDDRVRLAFLAMTPDAVSWFSEDGPGHWRLDLWAATIDQLVDAGLEPTQIDVARVCTSDHPETCFSYRRDGAGTGRLVAAIRIRT